MTQTGPMPRDPSCIFCRIATGEIPCYRLHEDETILAFLDVAPLSRGHCLIIPKAHYATIDRLPDELAAACGTLIPRLTRAVVAATGATAWNVLQNNGRPAGQAVEHVHFHIIPRREGDGLGFPWPAGSLGAAEAGELVRAITARL